ncbi:MAG: DUF3858 domain-containing protein [Candidatus Aminicenantes bacterium]|nr:DUF3858 domain-containing protein [Candidatus Aminicenantes bacterium]
MKKSLGEKMAARLPEGGRASVLKMENMSGFEDEVRIDFEVAIPAAATPAGDRLLLPVVPYRATWRESFRHTRRTSSVYLPYLVNESDDIVIALPNGIRIESVPGATGSQRSFSRYSLSAEVEAGVRLRVRRELTILKNRIPAEQYPVLRSFFDQARAGDEGQVILAIEKK